MEYLDPAPVANTGPKRRGRWAQPGVELSVRSMLDLRQIETLAPSPRGPSQDSLAVSPAGPGKHGPQGPELSCVSQVSYLSPSSLEVSGSLSRSCANSRGLRLGTSVHRRHRDRKSPLKCSCSRTDWAVL